MMFYPTISSPFTLKRQEKNVDPVRLLVSETIQPPANRTVENMPNLSCSAIPAAYGLAAIRAALNLLTRGAPISPSSGGSVGCSSTLRKPPCC